MVLVICLDAMDKRQVIYLPGQVGIEFRDIPSRLSMLLEIKGTSHADMGKGKPPLQFSRDIRKARQWFAVQFFEFRFVFKGVDLADTPLHKKKDTVLGLSYLVRHLLGKRAGGAWFFCCQLVSHHRTKCQRTDAIIGMREKGPA